MLQEAGKMALISYLLTVFLIHGLLLSDVGFEVEAIRAIPVSNFKYDAMLDKQLPPPSPTMNRIVHQFPMPPPPAPPSSEPPPT